MAWHCVLVFDDGEGRFVAHHQRGESRAVEDAAFAVQLGKGRQVKDDDMAGGEVTEGNRAGRAGIYSGDHWAVAWAGSATL